MSSKDAVAHGQAGRMAAQTGDRAGATASRDSELMDKLFTPLLVVTALMFAYSPIAIANAPYESTMLLVQKIFYYHFPTWMALTVSVVVCTIASAIYLFKGSARADRIAAAAAEVTVIFGLFGLVSGSLWGRKAWGVWWQWDARLTTALLLELILLAYLVLRRYGGPGAEKLAAGVALFGMADSVIVYKSVDWWRTVHPTTNVKASLGQTSPAMYGTMLYCSAAFLMLFALLMIARVGLERRRAELDELFLALEEQ
jgi:heme exporter protein C